LCPRFFDKSILSKIRLRYKQQLKKKISKNELELEKSKKDFSKNIEMVIEQRKKQYNLDHIANSIFSQRTSHVNAVCSKNDVDKENIFKTRNIVPLNSYEISDNNLFNESDRNKLIMTNDNSQIEGNNKSDLFQNLINKDNVKKELDDKNLKNQLIEKINSSETKKSYTIEGNEKVGRINDGKSMKSKKENQDKKLKNEKNLKELLYEKKIKHENLNKKSFVGTDEEIIMDFDIDIIISEEDNKRERKVRFLENIENLSKTLEAKNKNEKYENIEKINFNKNSDKGLDIENIEVEDGIDKFKNNLLQIKEGENIKSKAMIDKQNENSEIILKKIDHSNKSNLNKMESFSRKRRSNLRIKKININQTHNILKNIDLNNNPDSINNNSTKICPNLIFAENSNMESKVEAEVSQIQNQSKIEISSEKNIN